MAIGRGTAHLRDLTESERYSSKRFAEKSVGGAPDQQRHEGAAGRDPDVECLDRKRRPARPRARTRAREGPGKRGSVRRNTAISSNRTPREASSSTRRTISTASRPSPGAEHSVTSARHAQRSRRTIDRETDTAAASPRSVSRGRARGPLPSTVFIWAPSAISVARRPPLIAVGNAVAVRPRASARPAPRPAHARHANPSGRRAAGSAGRPTRPCRHGIDRPQAGRAPLGIVDGRTIVLRLDTSEQEADVALGPCPRHALGADARDVQLVERSRERLGEPRHRRHWREIGRAAGRDRIEHGPGGDRLSGAGLACRASEPRRGTRGGGARGQAREADASETERRASSVAPSSERSRRLRRATRRPRRPELAGGRPARNAAATS